MRHSFWFRVGLVLLGAGLLVPAPAMAQFSKSGKFLQAVRDKDVDEAMNDLSDPGAGLVNTHDLANGQTALHIVTERRDLMWMRFLITKGADVNARDGHGLTPLVLASNLGFVEGMALLVDKGAHPDEPSATGETPLISAVHRHDLAAMRILLAGGANPDRADHSGRSARDYAQMSGKGGPMLTLIEQASKSRGGQGAGTYGPSL